MATPAQTRNTLRRARATRDFPELTRVTTASKNFFLSRARLAQLAEDLQLIGRLFLADFAHGEADVDEHPIADHGRVVFEQLQAHFPAHTHDVDGGQAAIVAG